MFTFNHIRIFCNYHRKRAFPISKITKICPVSHIYFDIASSLSQIVMTCLIHCPYQKLDINYFTLPYSQILNASVHALLKKRWFNEIILSAVK